MPAPKPGHGILSTSRGAGTTDRRPHDPHTSSPLRPDALPRLAIGRPSISTMSSEKSIVRAADPKFEGVADTSALLASRALAESRSALAAGNADRAELFARTAADAGAPAAEVADLNAKIMSLRVVSPAAVAVPEPTVVPESSLRRTAFMPPNYPARARERGTEGWVDLEFTVSKDGTTRDAVVRAAEPTGTFDRAALDGGGRARTVWHRPRSRDAEGAEADGAHT